MGNHDQYKDGHLALEAFRRLSMEDPDLHLMFVGGGAFRRQELSDVPPGVRDKIHQRSLSDAQMPAVYAHARALIFPSHFEGFGMPILEAMACGTPVVAARASSLPEVGGEACIYFTPGHLDEFIDAIQLILNNESQREQMRELGVQRASSFSWHRAATEYARIYRS